MTPAAYKRVEMMCSNLKRTKGSRQEVYNRYSREIADGGCGLFPDYESGCDALDMLNAYVWAELDGGAREIEAALRKLGLAV